MKLLVPILFIAVVLSVGGYRWYYVLPARVIDAHAHIDYEGVSDEGPIAKFEAEAKASHVVGAVTIATLDYPLPKKKPPAHMVACAAVSPESKIHQIEKNLKEKITRCLKIYLGYIPLPANHATYLPYYRLAEKYSVPVILHTGDTLDKDGLVKYADPLSIDEIAVQFPRVKFVIAHCGNPWFETTAEVVYKNDNVYVDLSGILIGDLSKIDSESLQKVMVDKIRWAFLYVGNPKKFLFGTDWPLVELEPYIRVVQRAIPRRYWDEVFYSNAVSLFQMAPR